MARTVHFLTKGHIPIESFTTFGVNSKPNSENPIGHFGTGLKYGISVLVRHKLKVRVLIGKDEYSFFIKSHKFRGKDFDFVTMKAKVFAFNIGGFKIREHKLPFTTELGKGWELWQAFRELYANTLDEDGTAFLGTEADPWIHHHNDCTTIVVEGESFVKEFLDKDRNFLPDGLKQADTIGQKLQVLDRPSQHVYYRGMRVHDLPKETPSQFTYNFLTDIVLTEDRTAKNTWEIESIIQDYISSSEDEVFVEKAVRAPEGTLERSLNYSYIYRPPSETFKTVAQKEGASVSAKAHVKKHEPPKKIPDPFKDYPRPWTLNGDQVLDKNGDTVFDFDMTSLTDVEKAHIVEAINVYQPRVVMVPTAVNPEPGSPLLDEEIPF